MARRISRKSMKQDEFVAAAFDAGEWLEEHWKSVALAIVGVIAAVLLVYAWMVWSARRLATAGEIFGEGYEMYSVARTDAEPSDPRYAETQGRFEEAAARAGRGPFSDVAVLYQGLTHMLSGDPAEAVSEFEEVADRTTNPVMRSTARANLAEALSASGEIDRAAELWRELAAAEPPYYPPDHALLNLGKLLAGAGRESEAQEVFRDVVADYPRNTSGTTAQALLDGTRSGQ